MMINLFRQPTILVRLCLDPAQPIRRPNPPLDQAGDME